MPVFHVGSLVKPNPGHWGFDSEDNPDALGLILEMRSLMKVRPEAKIKWNDVGPPAWTILDEVSPVE